MKRFVANMVFGIFMFIGLVIIWIGLINPNNIINAEHVNEFIIIGASFLGAGAIAGYITHHYIEF